MTEPVDLDAVEKAAKNSASLHGTNWKQEILKLCSELREALDLLKESRKVLTHEEFAAWNKGVKEVLERRRGEVSKSHERWLDMMCGSENREKSGAIECRECGDFAENGRGIKHRSFCKFKPKCSMTPEQRAEAIVGEAEFDLCDETWHVPLSASSGKEEFLATAYYLKHEEAEAMRLDLVGIIAAAIHADRAGRHPTEVE